MASHPKLFIPGPVEVSEATLAAFSKPMVGHRSKDFQALFASVQPLLQRAFHTSMPAYLSTSSAWGIMEGAVRNLVSKKVLNCMSGAFSDKWYDVARKCGKEAEPLQVEWGRAIKPEAVREALSKGGFDAITLIHNETSTGVMNPLEDIVAVVREFPEVSIIVDCVSSFTVVPIDFDRLGIDLLLAGTQKALALPSGAAVFTVSERAYAKAGQQKDRGYYFDLVEFRKNGEKNMTPTTPSISHFYALEHKLNEIMTEGLEARYERHAKTNALVRKWAADRGIAEFNEPGYGSVSLTCLSNNKETDLPALAAMLREKHNVVMDGGYGKIKGKTFRISNMGDETEATVGAYLDSIDACLNELSATA